MTDSNFSLLLKQLEALLDGESDYIANAANMSSLIYNNLPDLNWVGFYFLREGELVLGPFNGQPACTRIPNGQGVCGTAFASQETQRVDDVHLFAGHIACDAASESEVVVPFKTDKIAGVFDIDSPVKARFSDAEQSFFEAAVAIYVRGLI
ncbi:protein YtsP [Arenicella chitinivorans]|uniref:Protein YtsP n=1 Tax=Arenicella chitinivorans TaxID=1329800 RepID=A0A918RKV9_9GAMM|nr:GAF domain-containing protein [Arenicella chitinivorans]GHA02100.1 protein YtsP [Arenicella chitinivorans]